MQDEESCTLMSHHGSGGRQQPAPSPVLAEVLGAYACRLACKVLWQAAQHLLHHGQVLKVVVRLEQRITCRVQARMAEAASVARSIKSYESPRRHSFAW